MKLILFSTLFFMPTISREYTVVSLVLKNACNCTLALTKRGKLTETPRVLNNKPTLDTIRLEIEKEYSGVSLKCDNGGGNMETRYTPGKTFTITADFTSKPCN